MKTVAYLVVAVPSVVLVMIPKSIWGLCVKDSLDWLVMPGEGRQERLDQGLFSIPLGIPALNYQDI